MAEPSEAYQSLTQLTNLVLSNVKLLKTRVLQSVGVTVSGEELATITRAEYTNNHPEHVQNIQSFMQAKEYVNSAFRFAVEDVTIRWQVHSANKNPEETTLRKYREALEAKTVKEYGQERVIVELKNKVDEMNAEYNRLNQRLKFREESYAAKALNYEKEISVLKEYLHHATRDKSWRIPPDVSFEANGEGEGVNLDGEEERVQDTPEVTQLKKLLKTQEDHITKLTAKAKELESDGSNKAKELANTRTKLQQETAAVNKLRSEVGGLSNTNEILQRQVDEKNDELTELKDQLAKIKEQQQGLERQVSSLEKDKTELTKSASLFVPAYTAFADSSSGGLGSPVGLQNVTSDPMAESKNSLSGGDLQKNISNAKSALKMKRSGDDSAGSPPASPRSKDKRKLTVKNPNSPEEAPPLDIPSAIANTMNESIPVVVEVTSAEEAPGGEESTMATPTPSSAMLKKSTSTVRGVANSLMTLKKKGGQQRKSNVEAPQEDVAEPGSTLKKKKGSTGFQLVTAEMSCQTDDVVIVDPKQQQRLSLSSSSQNNNNTSRPVTPSAKPVLSPRPTTPNKPQATSEIQTDLTGPVTAVTSTVESSVGSPRPLSPQKPKVQYNTTGTVTDREPKELVGVCQEIQTTAVPVAIDTEAVMRKYGVQLPVKTGQEILDDPYRMNPEEDITASREELCAAIMLLQGQLETILEQHERIDAKQFERFTEEITEAKKSAEDAKKGEAAAVARVQEVENLLEMAIISRKSAEEKAAEDKLALLAAKQVNENRKSVIATVKPPTESVEVQTDFATQAHEGNEIVVVEENQGINIPIPSMEDSVVERLPEGPTPRTLARMEGVQRQNMELELKISECHQVMSHMLKKIKVLEQAFVTHKEKIHILETRGGLNEYKRRFHIKQERKTEDLIAAAKMNHSNELAALQHRYDFLQSKYNTLNSNTTVVLEDMHGKLRQLRIALAKRNAEYQNLDEAHKNTLLEHAKLRKDFDSMFESVLAKETLAMEGDGEEQKAALLRGTHSPRSKKGNNTNKDRKGGEGGDDVLLSPMGTSIRQPFYWENNTGGSVGDGVMQAAGNFSPEDIEHMKLMKLMLERSADPHPDDDDEATAALAKSDEENKKVVVFTRQATRDMFRYYAGLHKLLVKVVNIEDLSVQQPLNLPAADLGRQLQYTRDREVQKDTEEFQSTIKAWDTLQILSQVEANTHDMLTKLRKQIRQMTTTVLDISLLEEEAERKQVVLTPLEEFVNQVQVSLASQQQKRRMSAAAKYGNDLSLSRHGSFHLWGEQQQQGTGNNNNNNNRTQTNTPDANAGFGVTSSFTSNTVVVGSPSNNTPNSLSVPSTAMGRRRTFSDMSSVQKETANEFLRGTSMNLLVAGKKGVDDSGEVNHNTTSTNTLSLPNLLAPLHRGGGGSVTPSPANSGHVTPVALSRVGSVVGKLRGQLKSSDRTVSMSNIKRRQSVRIAEPGNESDPHIVGSDVVDGGIHITQPTPPPTAPTTDNTHIGTSSTGVEDDVVFGNMDRILSNYKKLKTSMDHGVQHHTTPQSHKKQLDKKATHGTK